MKIVEIKNSLAKLYYEPADLPLVLSDFLTVDDENQKILSQVVSIESTSKEGTNCAILKFSLDIKDDNSFEAYSGYTPALDAKVEKTPSDVLTKIFSSSPKSINVGHLTNSTEIELNIKASVLDNFLYIQSDRQEETSKTISKILEFNSSNGLKTLSVDFKGVTEYNDASVIELGKDFKLPIGNETLDYIYENDLTGLTLEQKTIVQDIILEIQDYINTLESGFIPFDTLLDVVNDIYESDKSTGIILLRNKLLKYKQYNIFASSQEEIDTLKDSVENNTVTVLAVSNININWQKEAFDFVLNNIKNNCFLIVDIEDEIVDKNLINKIYKSKNLKPVISSKYDYENAQLLKSYAKNLILFKPEEQQRAFATYNSFLMKLAQKEFIVSGEATFYTPLIVKEFSEKLMMQISVCEPKEIINESVPQEIESDSAISDSLTEIEPLEENELDALEEDTESNDLKNIFEESLEQEIAKDVDQMFYSAPTQEALETEEEKTVESEEQSEITELQEIEEVIETEIEPEMFEEPEEIEPLQEVSALSEDNEINYEDMFSDDDLDMLDNLNTAEKIDEEKTTMPESLESLDSLETLETLDSIEPADVMENLTENESLPSIPIYKTELDKKSESAETIKIAEGNIVYHEKYGRGVVEELFNYGKRTLCSIQFDNVGRRLLDPNLAELKQM